MLSNVYSQLSKVVKDTIGNINIYNDDDIKTNSKENIHIFLEGIEESDTKGISKCNLPYLINLKFSFFTSGTDKVKSNSNLINLLKVFLNNPQYKVEIPKDAYKQNAMFYVIVPFELESKVESNVSIVKQPLIIDKKIINQKRS